MSAHRVTVLALDAASPQLLREWANDGTLPNLRSLMETGMVGDIQGLDAFFIGSTWPSFCTGVNAGRHGFHYQWRLEPGTYRLRPVAEDEPTRVAPFWRALSDAGRRIAILDVPLSKLDQGINGVQVVEWGVHDDLYGFGAVPPALGTRILEKYGAHQIGAHCDSHGVSADDYQDFASKLIQSINTKVRLTSEILEQEHWDFTMQVFSESHCVGHQCWHLHDPSHPAFEATLRSNRGEDPVKRVYQALDGAVGELASVSRDSTLIVMTAHGMTHWYGATFLLRDILFALGAAAPRQTAEGDKGGGASVPRRIWKLLPAQARSLLAPLRDALLHPNSRQAPTLTGGIEAARSKCFPMSNGLGTGAIRLNIAGREPEGVLQPGAEVEAFLKQLMDDLAALTDADTGARLVDRVVRTETVCDGPALEFLPDLVIEWSRTRPVGSTRIAGGLGAKLRVQHPRVGVVDGANAYGRTGEHEPGGFFVAVGPGIQSGATTEPVSLFDFAPTFCRLLGCSSPYSDGRPIAGLIDRPDSR